MEFTKIDYNDLSAKAKEIYNFQKLSGILADYGYSCMWLNNDWQGASFIAAHLNGESTLKIHLKRRLTFDKRYLGKGIYVCFKTRTDTYLYPHDEVLELMAFTKTDNAWLINGKWSCGRLSKRCKEKLEKYKLY